MRIFLSLVLAAIALDQVDAYDSASVRAYPAHGSLRFELKDEIASPIYSWPRTLLSYPVDFSHAPVKPEELQLFNLVTGQPEPMQLSEIEKDAEGNLRFAVVNFFSDLPPGATRSFELRPGTPAAAAGISESTGDGYREIDTGKFKVRIPVSQSVGGKEGPGPILALNAGRGWIGSSQIVSPVKSIERVDVAPVEKGSLFATYKITYTFSGGGIYEAVVKAIWNYDFLDFSEKMTGLDEADHAVFEQAWTGFDPTRRFGAGGWKCPGESLGIDEPVTTGGNIEDPHWFVRDYVEDPAREMIYRLASFSGNSVREAVPVMSFWDDRPGGQELGVFVPDTKGWNDGQYMVWQPSTLLQVRFRHADSVLDWSWPLVTGTRRTGIELTDAAGAEAAVQAVRVVYKEAAEKKRWAFVGKSSPPKLDDFFWRHAQLLRSWYGGLDLNRVKDWKLSYPATAKAPVNLLPEGSEQEPKEAANMGTTPADLETFVTNSQLMLYPLGLNLALLNLSEQEVRPMVEQYLKLRGQMSEEQRARIDALLLLSCYVCAGEDLSPIRTCATGTPNMSAESYGLPALVSVLYPDHPMGAEWRDQFEKAVELQACFYTRPDVPLWGAEGGRWAESMGTYNWADLLGLEKSQSAATMVDGRNRLANPWMAERGRWMVDDLSAPIFNPDPYWRQQTFMKTGHPQVRTLEPAWKPGMALSTSEGFERQYPAHGAHGTGTGMPIPDLAPVLGEYLQRYDPLTAEHLLWVKTQSAGSDPGEFAGSPWTAWEMKRLGANSGTNPHLASCKYTGHGLILRAGVGTPEEVSVHLDQVDQGPNYRWGNNGEGSSGVLYFFAGGKVWAGHERENTGDHSNDDTTGTTTYGVLHDDEYRSIGDNVLDRPLYDLGVVQFGELAARRDHDPYSWPAYKSRSVLLVGTDYMVITDDAEGPGRFSWFTMSDLSFPKIVFLQPLSTRTDSLTLVQTATSKGLLRDSPGPSIVLVTHKGNAVEMEEMKSTPCPVLGADGIREYAWDRPKGEKAVQGLYKVKTPGGHDLLFRSTLPIRFAENDKSFSGRAGVIRTCDDGHTELALVQGSEIGANGVVLTVPEEDEVGIGATFKTTDHVAGTYVAPRASRLTVQVSTSSGEAFYIDGANPEMRVQSAALQVQLPAGRHRWELTAGKPKPIPPIIVRTENGADQAKVFFSPVAAAEKYRIEASRDGGKTFEALGETSASPFTFHAPEGAGGKIHVRIIACNSDQASDPGDEYPVYLAATPPLPPDGLSLVLDRNRVDLSWGEVLGVSEYRLYRRLKGHAEWGKIYAGLARSYADLAAQGALPPFPLPGAEDKPLNLPPYPVYEYAVSAVNANGEGPKSDVADSDPAGWRNWWPPGQERRFKRQTAFWLPPYVSAAAAPPLRYPDGPDPAATK